MKRTGILSLLILVVLATSGHASNSDPWMNKGYEAFNKGEFGQAVSYFKKATELDPGNGDYFRWLGCAYGMNSQYQESVDALKQALNLPHVKDYEDDSWFWLARGYEGLRQGDQAIASMRKCIELSPTDSNWFVQLSRLYDEEVRYEEAITAAKRAIQLTADSAPAHYYLGYAYRLKKRYAEALDAIKMAIEIDPNSAIYLGEMGELFFEKEDYPGSAEAFKKAAGLQPATLNSISHFSGQARAQMLMGKYDDAIAALDRIIAIQTYGGIGVALVDGPGYPVVKGLVENGTAQKAGIEVGDRIVKVNRTSTKGWNAKRAGQSLRGAAGAQIVLTIEREGIKKSLDKFVVREDLIPKEAASYFGVRSMAYRHKGFPEAAFQDAHKAYLLDPANDLARYSLGASYLDKGTYDEAIRLLAQVKDNASARLLEATAFAEQGQMEEAARLYDSVTEAVSSPNNVPLMNDRRVLLRALTPLADEHKDKAGSLEAKGLYEEALVELSEALKIADEKAASKIREAIFGVMKKSPSLSGRLPEEAREHVVRGEMLVKEGSFEKAAAEFQRAIRIAPYAARLYYNSALILAELKRYPEAIRQMKTYLEAAPEASDARAAKDEVYKWEFLMEKTK